MGIEGTFLNITKVVDDKPIAYIILNEDKTTIVPFKIINKMGMSIFTTLIQQRLEMVAIAIRQQEMKAI